MPDPTADAAANSASRRRKMLIAGNLLMWLFEGAYIVSPIDLITDVLPVIGWADDFLGFIVAIAFTIYTIRTLRTHGVQGVLRTGPRLPEDRQKLLTTQKTEDTPTIVDVKVESTKDIPGYEPVPPDKIKSL